MPFAVVETLNGEVAPQWNDDEGCIYSAAAGPRGAYNALCLAVEQRRLGGGAQLALNADGGVRLVREFRP